MTLVGRHVNIILNKLVVLYKCQGILYYLFVLFVIYFRRRIMRPSKNNFIDNSVNCMKYFIDRNDKCLYFDIYNAFRRRKSMKKFIALSLSMVTALSLVACGGGSEADSGGEAKDEGGESGGKTEISVVAAEYGQNTKEWWKGFEADFEKDNADIDLQVKVVSWNDISKEVTTLISNENAPDILNIDVFADYQADDLLLPVEENINSSL